MKPEDSLRNAVLELAQTQYGQRAEYLWARTPGYAVLRHPGGKWYAVIMDLPRHRLGLSGDGLVDVLNVQVDPVLSGALRQQPGVLPGYHMNKERWITVLLDGTVAWEQIAILLDMSYALAGAKGKRNRS